MGCSSSSRDNLKEALECAVDTVANSGVEFKTDRELPDGLLGVDYSAYISVEIDGDVDTDESYTFELIDASELPPGLSMESDGYRLHISGVP